jgi:tetratricopeptide (TPR) repeat protein
MSNITPTSPSFVFGYWRPWKENSNAIDSYLDYVKDKSLVKYGADTVGKYISQASAKQVNAINNLGQAVGQGMNVLSGQIADVGKGVNDLESSLTKGINVVSGKLNVVSGKLNVISSQLDSVNASLFFINRNLDIQIEQQRLSNLLLQNISELLRVPDSEKERQHSIELGIKFFVNAQKDSDLYTDALEELLKAESLMKQDYFVLHRIGCIHLYVEKYLDPAKALDYFLRAGKYASVESDPKAVRLANVLTDNFNTTNTEINRDADRIQLLAADSYEKAAFAAYVLGQFDNAMNYQNKAVNYNATAQNHFLLSKYQVRCGNVQEAIQNLDTAIEGQPVLAIAVLKEIDLINEPEVLLLIEKKNEALNKKIHELVITWSKIDSIDAANIIAELRGLKELSYEIKAKKYDELCAKAYGVTNELLELKSTIDKFISEINNVVLCTLNKEDILNELIQAHDLPLEKMREVYNAAKNKVENDKPKIGSRYAGGIVFYVDKKGQHGLICSENDLGKHPWSNEVTFVGAIATAIGKGQENTALILSTSTKNVIETQTTYETVSEIEYDVVYDTVKDGWFSTKKVERKIERQVEKKVPVIKEVQKTITTPSSALECAECSINGYNDWYLPSIDELKLIYEQRHLLKNRNFENEYWSSSEFNSTNAWYFNFLFGRAMNANNKHYPMCVLPVRAF